MKINRLFFVLSKYFLYICSMKFKLRPYQEKMKEDTKNFLEKSSYKRGIIVQPVGCHSKGYKVFKSNGELIKVEDIKVGEFLMGDDSTPREVLELHNGEDDMYKITLRNNIELFVNSGHVLYLTRTGDNYRRNSIYNQHPKYVEISVKDYLKWSKNKKSFYKITRKGFIISDKKEYLIDPYYLGLWLGDGYKKGTQITTADSEIKNYLFKYANKLNLIYTEKKDFRTKSCSNIFLNIDNRITKKNIILQEFRRLGVLNNKHIPIQYLIGSNEDRLSLLSGLIDSDGNLDRRVNYDIIQKNPRLAYDIYLLAGSLGYNPNIREVYKRCCNCEDKSLRKYYKISFRGDENLKCLIDRKKVKKYSSNKNHNLYSFTIEYYGKDEYFGFSLDKNQLYIDENFIVHHNSGKSLVTAVVSELANSKCLIIQPSAELLKQNLEKARNFGLDPSVYSSSMRSKNISNLTYATPLSLANSADDFKDFDIIAIDESHLFMTNSLSNGKVNSKSKFNNFLEYINPSKIIGLTATPIQLVSNTMGSELKMMNRSRRSYWNQAEIFHVTQIQEIMKNYWANLDFRITDVDNSKLILNSTGNDFTDDSIIKAYEDNMSNQKVLEQYEQLISEGKNSILTFVPSIKIADELKKLNKDFEVVHSKMTEKHTSEIIQEFKKGNIPNVINCGKLTTGFDYPELDGIIMARNTNSFSLYYQIIGRLVRPIILPNGKVFKKQGVIVDLTTNYKRFGTIENITFEKQDYTKGWAMWNKDNIMTGYPFGEWKTPTRSEVQKHYNKSTIVNIVKLENYFTFGKHSGKKIKDVFNYDKGYLAWLIGNKDFKWESENMKNIKREIEYLFKDKIMNN